MSEPALSADGFRLLRNATLEFDLYGHFDNQRLLNVYLHFGGEDAVPCQHTRQWLNLASHYTIDGWNSLLTAQRIARGWQSPPSQDELDLLNGDSRAIVIDGMRPGDLNLLQPKLLASVDLKARYGQTDTGLQLAEVRAAATDERIGRLLGESNLDTITSALERQTER